MKQRGCMITYTNTNANLYPASNTYRISMVGFCLPFWEGMDLEQVPPRSVSRCPPSPFRRPRAEGYAATTPAARRNLSFPGTPDPDEDYFTPNKRVQTSHCVASGGTVMGGPPMRPNMGRGTEPGVQVVCYDIASTLCCAAVGKEGWCMVPSAQCSVKAHCLFRQDRI